MSKSYTHRLDVTVAQLQNFLNSNPAMWPVGERLLVSDDAILRIIVSNDGTSVAFMAVGNQT